MSASPENAVCRSFLSATLAPFGEHIMQQASGIPRYPLLDPSVRHNIDEFQDRIVSLLVSPHPDDEYARVQISRHFREHDASHAPILGTSSTMTEGADVLKWLSEARHSEVLDFLTWNRERLERHQQRLEQDTPNLQEVALQNINQVISTGTMPPVAKSIAEKIVFRLVNFVAIDAFEAGFRRAAGLFYSNEDPTRPYTIALVNGYEGGRDGFERWRPSYRYVMVHETWHAVGDVVLAGLHAIFDERHSTSWWNESEAEHLTQVGFHGEPDITSPRLRSQEWSGAYPSHRDLSHLIKTGGDVQIPQLLVGEALIEPFVSDGTIGTKDHLMARKELDRLLHHSFKNVIDLGKSGMNIVELIDYELSAVPLANRAAALDGWRQKLETALGITA